MSKFIFDPPNGLLDKNVFPSTPVSEEDARGQFMKLFNQIKEYLNDPKYDGVKGDNGYRVFHDGFIENYGVVSGVTNAWKTVRYTKAFPNKCVNIQLTEIASTGGATQTFIQSAYANNKELFTFKHEGTAERTFYYRALGY